MIVRTNICLFFILSGIKILILARRNQDYGQIQTGVLTLRSDSTQNFKATYGPVTNNFGDRTLGLRSYNLIV